MVGVECKWRTCEDTFTNNYEMLLHVLEEHVTYTYDQLKEIVNRNQQKKQDTQSQPFSSTKRRVLVPPPLPRRAAPTKPQLQSSSHPALLPSTAPTPSTIPAFEVERPHVVPPMPPTSLRFQTPQLVTPKPIVQVSPQTQKSQKQFQNPMQLVSSKVQNTPMPPQSKIPRMATPTDTPQMLQIPQWNQSSLIQQMEQHWKLPPSGFPAQMNRQSGGYWLPQSSILNGSTLGNRVVPEQSPSSPATHSPNSNSSVHQRLGNQDARNSPFGNNATPSLLSPSNPVVNSPPEVGDVVENLLNQKNPERVVIDARPLFPQIFMPQSPALIRPTLIGETKPKKQHHRHDLWVRNGDKWLCTWEGCGRTFSKNDQAKRHYDSVHLGRGKKGSKKNHVIQLN